MRPLLMLGKGARTLVSSKATGAHDCHETRSVECARTSSERWPLPGGKEEAGTCVTGLVRA